MTLRKVIKRNKHAFGTICETEFIYSSAQRGMTKINTAKMKCKKPQRTPDGPKKFVVKARRVGTEKIIRFGDSNRRV